MNDASKLDHPAFSELDRQFARLLERLGGALNSNLALAAALASWNQRQGNVCLDLAAVANQCFPWSDPAGDPGSFPMPPLGTWLSVLRESSVVGQPGEFKPLILDARNRLYFHRSWRYESDLTRSIQQRAVASVDVNTARLDAILDLYFPAECEEATDWQKVAAWTAVRKQLCVISGGPGTGKTRTVTVLLAILLELAGEGPLRMALAAPTGKAAARLQEAIKNVRAALPCREAIRARLPEEAFTLHRLLGWIPDSPRFKHDADSPLPFDVIVVDEASMVDLALMAKLFDALPRHARVILLGDKDQLASVEAGAVLGDLCHGAAPASAESRRSRPAGPDTTETTTPGETSAQRLRECIVHLQKNYRFDSHSGILALSRAVNDGDSERTLLLLREQTDAGKGVGSIPLPAPARLKDELRGPVLAGFREGLEAPDPRTALERLGRFRILCAVRHGPFGVENVNRIVEQILAEADLIPQNARWYAGRPVLVLKNDYNLRLFNGDVGIVLPDTESGQPRVFFLDAAGGLRRLAPARLPQHETVFAMTVHKSQGSEFEKVLLLLPDRESPVLTRELIYTGVTRAARQVDVWFAEPTLRAALSRRVDRASGLRDALWG